MRQLTDLNLSSNKINNIWSLLYLRQLQDVNLYQNEVNDLMAFYKHKKLVSLKLNYNKVICLLPLEHCTSLVDLSIIQNQIIDFKLLCDMKSLKAVDIDGNKLTDAASYIREYESSFESTFDEEGEEESDYPYNRHYDDYDDFNRYRDNYMGSSRFDDYDSDVDKRVGKFYFGQQNFANMADINFNKKLCAVTKFCIQELQNYYKIQHLRRNYKKLFKNTKQNVTVQMNVALKLLNQTVNYFVSVFSETGGYE
ncbi:leucine-rich_repeat domain-containing protein [Hexamita inflata]|uniref:Leucine-rich_repeat domain-containing protein n=1 Tax=Hexamita inflata TaxID=28002 RepID=A0ABP1IAK6_9EUKA